jgi:lipooligosaccharide transport system permease protein
MHGVIRILQRNALVYRHTWRGSLFSSFLQPTLYLLAMGVGVGSLVDRGGSGASLPAGSRFLDFVAPGVLAAACMQTATFESTWPISGKLNWRHTYAAITATPVRIRDVVLGELAWVGVRLATVAIAFTAAMTAFGVPRSRSALLAVPAALLTGLAFSAPLLAYASRMKLADNFNVVHRFVITPLFLFSGVFFPITRLPETLQWVAWLTPLFHGVELVRGLVLDTLESPIWLVHVVYLAAMLAAGYFAAVRGFTRKLQA